VEVLGTEKRWVRGLRVQKQELGEPDSSGRPRPVPIPGSEYEMNVDMVVVAIGTRPNPMVFTDTPDLERTRRGTVVANEQVGRTKKSRVWAGGDIVTGAATVISAMGAGKRAAADIDAYVNDSDQPWWVEPEEEEERS
jgi:glutamate synthase (NADPH/NADH) small chain